MAFLTDRKEGVKWIPIYYLLTFLTYWIVMETFNKIRLDVFSPLIWQS
jgi:hypothetical protein